jgi:hypothetical protein
VVTYLVLTLLDSFDPSVASSRQRTYRFHGGPYQWREIFETLKHITGYKYKVDYLPVDQALALEKEGKETGDVELELKASHQLIQGREGTLLPLPADNKRFPQVKTKELEDALRAVYSDPEKRVWLGL